MFVDTHCHLHFPEFNYDRDEVIKRARDEKIEFIINVASDLQGSIECVDLAAKHDFIYATVGIHPHDAKSVNDDVIKKVKDLLKSNNKIVAVGEVGLDYFRNISPREVQRQVFCEFIDIAREFDLPLILHTREADHDFLKILRGKIKAPAKGVVHCFSGSKEFADEILDMGFLISFTGNVTFKKARELQEVCANIDLEKIMIETDAPFLAPQIFRGKRNEPAFVRYIAEKIAELHGCDVERAARVTTRNAKKLFGIK